MIMGFLIILLAFAAAFYFIARLCVPLNLEEEYGVELRLRFKDFMLLYSADPTIFSISNKHLLCIHNDCWKSEDGTCVLAPGKCETCNMRFVAIDFSLIDRIRFRRWVAEGVRMEAARQMDDAINFIIGDVENTLKGRIDTLNGEEDQN